MQDERGSEVIDLTRAETADGDDIAIVTDAPTARPGGRRRMLWLIVGGLAVVAFVVASIATIVSTDDSASPAKPAIDTGAALIPTNTAPPAKNTAVKKPVAKNQATPTTVAAAAPTVAVTAPPQPAQQAPQLRGGVVPARPASAHKDPAPSSSPVSALVWTAPNAITMQTGTTKSVSVSAHNPTAAAVTLPHPLSCAPRLQHDEVCPEMVQLVAPGATASAQYTLDATGVPKGVYVLSIEGVRKITVTVTS